MRFSSVGQLGADFLFLVAAMCDAKIKLLGKCEASIVGAYMSRIGGWGYTIVHPHIYVYMYGV